MTTDNAKQESHQPGVGERLRKAREAARLTITEVADRQHLRPAVISAIENGDYKQIDSELFLKGYVRTYASQVGLDPESVIRQLDSELEPLREEQKARVEANPLINIERRKRRKRQIARIVVILVILAVLFYGGSLYLAREQAEVTGQTAGEGSAPQPGQVEEGTGDALPTGTQITSERIQGGSDGTLESTGSPNDTSGSGVDSGISDAAGADDGSSVDATVKTQVESGQDVDDSTAELVDNSAGAPSEAADQDTAVRSEPLDEVDPAVSVADEGRLTIEFSGDCWVEVQDSTGRTLEASLRSAGDTLELTAEPPLRVVLGAVSGVDSVRFGGEAVNLSERQVRNNRLVLNLP